ncbi:uncharacterized protein LOC117101118 [Anneissia japonica]|uniref:uncharacterized protein LOC117101118 n=1 Tax=Anneissia japonica TaxID=1529436 RepID=UPI00142550EF|nr:uncharacterized protein LOC117101118 [Anneissia japonica]XP_033096897.1 uncharacterized protein LOC117101118 [Anneissia japonica]
MQVPGSPFQNSGFSLTNPMHNHSSSSTALHGAIRNGNTNHLKRRCLDPMEGSESKRRSPQKNTMSRGKQFLFIKGGVEVFHSENFLPKGETLFLPLQEDVMINLMNIEQISISNGVFFIANASGTYQSTQQGDAIHLWRYDAELRQLFISRSILFLEPSLFGEVKQTLESLL